MVCKPIIISQFGLFASLRQCCSVCFTRVCVAAFPVGHTSFCLSLACWAGTGGCTVNPAVILSNPPHSYPVALIQKAETAWQLWKMMDNVACFGFLRQENPVVLIWYVIMVVEVVMLSFFCAGEHTVNTFFIELNGLITGACRRGIITKDYTNHPTSTSILSNSADNVSLGAPFNPCRV